MNNLIRHSNKVGTYIYILKYLYIYHFDIFFLGCLYGLKLEALALMKVTSKVELNVGPILIKTHC
jgi:hypothetical protein